MRLQVTFSFLGMVASACLVGSFDIKPALEGAGSGNGGKRATGNDGGRGGESGEALGSGGVDDPGGAPPAGGKQGGSSGSTPVGGTDAAGSGAGGGAGTGNAMPCLGYAEANDAGNAFVFPDAAGEAEPTGQTLSGQVDICGQLDPDRFNDATGVLDVDSYTFQIAQAGEVYASVEFGSPVGANFVELVVSGPGGIEQRVTSASQAASMSWKLSAGTHTVSVVGRSETPLTKPLNYVIRAGKDNIGARCPTAVAGEASGEYAEKFDGVSHTENDVVIPSLTLATQVATADGADEAEFTPFGIRSGLQYLLSGSLANVDHGASAKYLDGDAYSISPFGSQQFTFRLEWAGSTSDLDLWFFKEDDFRAIAHATTVGKTSPELMTVAVDNTDNYWVWVGAAKGSTDLPKSYQLTVCGGQVGL